MNVLMMLGPIRFSVDAAAYDNLKRRAEYRWPVMERLGRRVAHQFVGIGSETINLKGTIYPTFDPYSNGSRIGIYRVSEMRSIAEQGTPMDLITGYGEVMGRFCIKAVEETETAFFENGAFRKQEFEVELTRYGEDEAGLDGIVFMGGSFVLPRLQINASVTGPLGLNIGGSITFGGL